MFYELGLTTIFMINYFDFVVAVFDATDMVFIGIGKDGKEIVTESFSDLKHYHNKSRAAYASRKLWGYSKSGEFRLGKYVEWNHKSQENQS